MWLINTTDLRLEKFQECPAKTYAILSHTWGTDTEELDFDEFKAGRGREKIGFNKIRLCCEQAKSDGIQYAWVDTCCIDKRSSTELSEAINSMFAWYAKSKICYVYLADVSCCSPVDALKPGHFAQVAQVFKKSRWFTRGWTLQELVAPEALTFFTKEWIRIGDKANLAKKLHSVTSIDINVLRLKKSFLSCSIAQRMSWASSRHTTRLEDMAYCLIGLFDVNLPLIYGEGSKAFLRLQKQIIDQTDDETIFAWGPVPAGGSGLLAPSVKHFACAATTYSLQHQIDYGGRSHYFSTNKGLLFECEMIPYAMHTYMVPLHCYQQGNRIFIFLTKTAKDGQYRRTLCEGSSFTDKTWMYHLVKPRVCKVFVSENSHGLEPAPYGSPPLLLVQPKLNTWHFRHHGERSWSRVPVMNRIQFGKSDISTGVIVGCLKRSSGHDIASFDSRPWCDFEYCLHFGFDQEFSPICILHRKYRPGLLAVMDDTCYLTCDNSDSHTLMSTPAAAEDNESRYDDPRSVTVNLPLNLCTYIEVTLRPLAGVDFTLTITENRRHKQESARTDLCFTCLATRVLGSNRLALLLTSVTIKVAECFAPIPYKLPPTLVVQDVLLFCCIFMSSLSIMWPPTYGQFAQSLRTGTLHICGITFSIYIVHWYLEVIYYRVPSNRYINDQFFAGFPINIFHVCWRILLQWIGIGFGPSPYCQVTSDGQWITS